MTTHKTGATKLFQEVVTDLYNKVILSEEELQELLGSLGTTSANNRKNYRVYLNKNNGTMTLQEKIDKLPLSIEYEGKVYNLRMYTEKDEIVLVYILYNHNTLFHVKDDRILLKTSFRLEELIDRALTIIENKEWEK